MRSMGPDGCVEARGRMASPHPDDAIRTRYLGKCSQVPFEGVAMRSAALVARGNVIASAGDAGELPKAGDGAEAGVGEDDEPLVQRLCGSCAPSHAIEAAPKVWSCDMRFSNETRGSTIVSIIQEARAYLVAMVRGVHHPAPQRRIAFPHNSIPQHKIEDELEFTVAKERALKVETIALRAIHGWIFKFGSRERGYHLAYQYALNHSATDIARAMWAVKD
ncbi:hypothetical protein CBR_g3418 [Chara braunii]|uniref:Uncharacterized protein n=1 Tax=Chara braunii TaxID=69332 RepID=A0A388JQT9_CHABU|nr:hypothetical protein CBR_g3418 [Chara braunii]|eukprot:GBG60174.1 hypothetical protein CBR_g3418 [Chara braunii]